TRGVKFVKTSLVFLFFTAFGPKQYPRKSNLVFGYLPLRFASLQWTILFFSGCISIWHSANRAASFAFTAAASASVRQCTSPSSAYRHQGRAGYSRAIHASNANEITHRLVAFVRHPPRGKLASPQKFG